MYSDLLHSRPYQLAVELFKAISIGTSIFVLFALLLHDELLNLRFIGVFWLGTFLLSWGIRASIVGIMRRTIAREDSRPTFLIVGVNGRSLELAESMENNPATAHRLIGFVDVGETEPGDDDSRPELLTDVAGLQAFLRHTPVDEVLVCLPMKSHYDAASRVVSICEEQGVTAKILADFFQTRMTHSRTEAFGDYSVITVATHEMTGMPAFLKRAFDVVVSALLLALLSPLLLTVAILVGFSSHGPVLFAQERVGLNKKIFRMLKFRTMVVDAEVRQAALEALNEAEGPAFKISRDPRITTVGRILRKASIDELPQLLNVIKGDMSLVGPRPLPLRDYAGFQEDWHRRRLSVRPGITGLWQVKDRDHSSFDNWMKLDMQYINQWSLMLDFKILLETIPAVLRGSGE
jgi:exopolysaccharide biosynthesis polyprenyl glycosylphosphotransferase